MENGYQGIECPKSTEITETVLQAILDSLRNLTTEDIIRNTPDPPTPRHGVLYMRMNREQIPR